MRRAHHSDYDEAATSRCERTLVTLLGDIGPSRERISLAGGLAPRNIVGQLPDGVPPHVGTTDVDLVIGLALDEAPETSIERAGAADSSSTVAAKEVGTDVDRGLDL